ncbi:hypothetical protein CI238_12106 [Colletotrichum incanum]|uniref:Uncharacterized protein n=1 Tax=Colletotrichum incanum TaxID=1573173 RepID=A0A161WKW5_COLIC|nr:hypothetical protein CI238_12106 [Colletotrichum incanum]
MESLTYERLDEDCAISYETPEFLTSATFDSRRDGPAAEPSLTPEQTDQPSGDRAPPLLRLSDWNSTKQYDKNNPECIHYDFRWKVSQREKIRARQVCSDTDLNLVLAPSDFWTIDFKPQLATLLKDENKFPGDAYTCEETIIDISIKRSRSMKEGEKEEEVDIDIEIPSKILGDILNDSCKRKAEDSVNCYGFKAYASSNGWLHNMGEMSFIENYGEVEGDRMDRLEEYCNWSLQQVKSDKWREALQAANQFAMDQFLELNSILKHPKVAADLMVKGGVKLGIALQFVSNISKFQQETK